LHFNGIIFMRVYRTFLLLATLSSFPVFAENLQQVYVLAVANDAVLHAAAAALVANEQALPQAIAQLLPNASANYQTTGASNNAIAPFQYNTRNYGITVNQPLFYPQLWAQLEGARHQVKGATAVYLSTTQALIIRVAEQYFAVLAAYDNLHFAESSRKSFGQTLEQAKQRFDVGLIAITDVQDAKAKYDNAVALELSAQNALADQYEILRTITGVRIAEVKRLPQEKSIPLIPPSPDKEQAWVDCAHRYNLDLIAAQEQAKTLKAAIGVAVGDHFPNITLSGSVNRSLPPPPRFSDLITTSSVTLNVSFPLFESGGAIFRTREARARYDESLQQLEGTRRQIDSSTRQSFRGVLTAISVVKALAQAVISNRTSLEARRAAYSVGTRTIVDVLDAETALLDAERTFAKARYDYLLEGLRLKQAAGTLTTEDLVQVSTLL